MTEAAQQSKYRGVAALFKGDELKKFVKSYIFFLLLLEIFIFVVCFVCQLEPINIPFPWKNYFLGALLIPIGITFLLGVVATAFNLFLFGENRSPAEYLNVAAWPGQSSSRFNKFNASLNAVRQAPFLLSLVLLCVGVILFAQFDTIFMYLGNIGEKAVQYLFIALAVVLGIATVFGFALLVVKFKLEKLKCNNEYRMKMAAQLGVFITDDNTLVDNKGKVFKIADARSAPAPTADSSEAPKMIARQENP